MSVERPRRQRTVTGAVKQARWRENIPRQRIGHPIDSQSANNKQMVENDFSPPLNAFGSLSLARA